MKQTFQDIEATLSKIDKLFAAFKAVKDLLKDFSNVYKQLELDDINSFRNQFDKKLLGGHY